MQILIISLVVQMASCSLPKDYILTNTNLSSTNKTNHFSLVLTVNNTTSYFLNLELKRKLRGDIFADDVKLVIVGNKTVDYDYNFNFLEGYANLSGSTNRASGYMKNNCFYGTFVFESFIYFIEDVEDLDFVVDGDVNAVVYLSTVERSDESFKFKYFESTDREKLYMPYMLRDRVGTGKICPVGIVLDYYYICKGQRNQITKAVVAVKDALDKINLIFRNTDFADDGQPNNIGLRIKMLIILLSPNSDFNIFPPYQELEITGEFMNYIGDYLFSFHLCVCIMVTSYPLHPTNVGESLLAERGFRPGGICDRWVFSGGSYVSRNVLWVSYLSDFDKFVFTMAHELGHSFGADHDIVGNCQGYLMRPQIPSRLLESNFRFSSCSKEDMLPAILSRGTCFEDETESFCGNGIVEPGEECDCGTIPQCRYDKCCNPRGTLMQCKKTGECHPSDGLCCNENCQYNDYSKINLDCRNIIKTCPCPTKPCLCGIDATCIGNECHSIECTRLNLQECSCRKSSSSVPCETCCKYKETCQSASLLTQFLTRDNPTLIGSLQNSIKLKAELTMISKEFCAGQKCVRLAFKNSMNNLCSVFGKLGKCLDGGICVLHIRQAIFSSTPLGNSCMFFCCWKSVSLPIFVVINWRINLL